MKIGLVSGDGLPVSGLLTVFRNVFDLGRRMGIVENAVPADIGYSWRPDKPAFFPYGPTSFSNPTWMLVAQNEYVGQFDRAALGVALTSIRQQVARGSELSHPEQWKLQSQIDELALVYQSHFIAWLEEHQPDWVFALNMTLSDAVPVTAALHRAAQEFYLARPGGIVFWDHDLFGSCAIWDSAANARAYPKRPNAFTPVPLGGPFTQWLVVSKALAEEAAQYPSDIVPKVVTNILPTVPQGVEERHLEFIANLGLHPDRPILLNPVRVFRIKGVDIAIQLIAAIKEAVNERTDLPYLLVFGSLEEDPEYTAEVVGLVEDLDVQDDVRFLDGVPLRSYRGDDGIWRLDEVDLIRVAASSHGAMAFTPSATDVETVGLGPALGALGNLPSVVTEYKAFHEFYGDDFFATRIGTCKNDISAGALAFVDILSRLRNREAVLLDQLDRNRRLAEERFPVVPWEKMLHYLNSALKEDQWGEFIALRARSSNDS